MNILNRFLFQIHLPIQIPMKANVYYRGTGNVLESVENVRIGQAIHKLAKNLPHDRKSLTKFAEAEIEYNAQEAFAKQFQLIFYKLTENLTGVIFPNYKLKSII